MGGDSLAQECNALGLKNYELRKGDTIRPDFSCNLGEPEGDPKIIVKYKEIKLELNIDSGKNFQSGTEFCNSNVIWSKYQNKQLSNNNVLKSMQISGNLDTTSDGLPNIPSEDIIGTLEPSQLEVGEGYWFVYDWVERPSLIIGDYNNQEVWCNPIDHSLTRLEEVNTRGDNCYLIPTSRLSASIECCSSDECKGNYNNQDIYCTEDFKCGFEKSCITDSDCGGVAETCQEENGKYYLVKSSCDKIELDSYGKGACISEKEEIKCCPNSCGSGMYCETYEGCKEVSYQSTSREIKTGIQGEKIKEDSSGITGAAIGSSDNSSSTGLIILIVFLILIGGSIGFYFYRNKNTNSPKPETETKTKTVPEQSTAIIPKGKFCLKCGSPLREGVRFCTKCGGRVRK